MNLQLSNMTYLVGKISLNVAHSTFMTYASACEKLEHALNLYAEKMILETTIILAATSKMPDQILMPPHKFGLELNICCLNAIRLYPLEEA